MDIYILRDGSETGPFSEEDTQRMLKQGEARITDLAWRPGMPEWIPLHSVIYPASSAPAPAAPPIEPLRVPAEPATAKQKAFLSYIGVRFEPEITKEQAALLVNDAMENPQDPARVARWNVDRLKLHPDLYASEIQARKEQRANRFHQVCETEGAECLDGVTKAHCQVLVSYLDVKYPNWDANETEATWNYFFPAVREKFPQLVRKEWKDKLKFPQAPKVAPELVRRPVVAVKRKRSSPLALLARGIALGLILVGVVVGVVYLQRHPDEFAALKKHGEEILAKLPKMPAAGTKSAPTTQDKPSLFDEPPGTAGQSDTTPAATDSVPVASAPAPAGSDAAPMTQAAPPAGTPAGTPAATAPGEANMSLFDPPPPTAPAPGAQPGAAPAEPAPGLLPGPKTHVRLIQPVKIETPYGPLEFRAGMTFPLISQEGTDVTVRFQGRIIDLPASATDLAGEAPTP
jgi:hypothetical protein